MSFPDNLNSGRSIKPGAALLLLLGFVLAGLFLSNFVGFMVLLPFFNGDIAFLSQLLENPAAEENARIPILILQLTASAGTFIVTPYLFLRYVEKKSIAVLSVGPKVGILPVAVTVLLVVAVMPVNSVFESWNRMVEFPEFLSKAEKMLQTQEERLGELTAYLTDFDSVWELLLGIIVIALIPAIGEELLFRGLVQRLFNRLFGNVHAAIWVSAFIFSAFHLQFYGLLPRLLLGALFGYLYFWSGNLRIPIIAHFINNAFTLVVLYLFKSGHIDTDPLTLEMSTLTVILSGVISAGLALLFYNYYRRYKLRNGRLENGLHG